MSRITLVFLAGILTLLAGCNTVEGFGQDVQSAGKSIEKSAK